MLWLLAISGIREACTCLRCHVQGSLRHCCVNGLHIGNVHHHNRVFCGMCSTCCQHVSDFWNPWKVLNFRHMLSIWRSGFGERKLDPSELWIARSQFVGVTERYVLGQSDKLKYSYSYTEVLYLYRYCMSPVNHMIDLKTIVLICQHIFCWPQWKDDIPLICDEAVSVGLSWKVHLEARVLKLY